MNKPKTVAEAFRLLMQSRSPLERAELALGICHSLKENGYRYARVRRLFEKFGLDVEQELSN